MKNIKSFDEIFIILKKANCPEEVFGELNESLLEIRRRLAWLVHPDVIKRKEATEAFQLLEKWYNIGEEKIKNGTYGDNSLNINITTKNNIYTLNKNIDTDSISDLFSAIDKNNKKVIIRIVRLPSNNDFIFNESQNLKFLHCESPAKDLKVMQHIIKLVDSFDLQQDKIKKRVNVFEFIKDAIRLSEVIKIYPNGIDPRDAAWMFNRILASLLAIHQSNIVHGSVIPEHFFIVPKTHNGVLTNFEFSVRNHGIVKAIVESRKNFYPSEILLKRQVNFSTDIYMAAKCMIALIHSKQMPKEILQLCNACLLSQQYRLNNVYELFTDFGGILEKLYGSRKFRHFSLKI